LRIVSFLISDITKQLAAVWVWDYYVVLAVSESLHRENQSNYKFPSLLEQSAVHNDETNRDLLPRLNISAYMPDRSAYAGLLTVLHAAFFARVAAAAAAAGARFWDGAGKIINNSYHSSEHTLGYQDH
jgi:hypothetical protein